jgi:hypothetical protein
MMADLPRIKKTLAILLPKILPMAISLVPLALETIMMNSSGADVPKAITVKPMARSEKTDQFVPNWKDIPTLDTTHIPNITANILTHNGKGWKNKMELYSEGEVYSGK